jgi:ABC-type sugar transport system ATPase subunit
VSKTYGATKALDAVDFDVAGREVHVLLGHNGAGKSTLVKIVSGVEKQDTGQVHLGSGTTGDEAGLGVLRKQVAAVHQQLGLIDSLSVVENICLVSGFERRVRGVIHWRESRAFARSLMAKFGVDVDVSAPVSSLPAATRVFVAFARALMLDSSIILLDEPTSNLGPRESTEVLEQIRALARNGRAVLLVTHRLDEAVDVADRITVLKDGRVAGELTRDTSANAAPFDMETVREMLVGDGAALRALRRRAEASQDGHDSQQEVGRWLEGRDVIVRAHDVRIRRSVGNRLGDVGPFDLTLGKGEVVGFFGSADAGQYELAEAISGRAKPDAGRLVWDLGSGPQSRRTSMPRLGYIPPDRHANGLFADMSVAENLFPTGRRSGWLLRRETEAQETAALFETYKIRASSGRAGISSLSGGNAQKVLLARVMSKDPSVLVLCDPTVGVDIATREEIWERVRSSAADGTTVVIVSEDVAELRALCDHVMVFNRGRIHADLWVRSSYANDELLKEDLLRALTDAHATLLTAAPGEN